MDKNKLSKIDCQTCKIIYDYTKICPHQTDATSNQLESWNELQEQMKVETKDSNIQEKINALRKVMNSLDAMSSVKETAFTIIRG